MCRAHGLGWRSFPPSPFGTLLRSPPAHVVSEGSDMILIFAPPEIRFLSRSLAYFRAASFSVISRRSITHGRCGWGGLCPLECTPSFLGLWHRMLIWRTFSVSVPPGAVPAPSPSPSGVLVTRFHASRSRPPADTGVECPALGCSVLLPLRSRPLRFAGSEVPTGVSSRLRTLLPAVSSPCAGCPVCPRQPLACASEARPVPGPTLSTARPAQPGSDARSSSTLCCFLPFFFSGFWNAL